MVYKLELKNAHHSVEINSVIELELDARITNELIMSLHFLEDSIEGGLNHLECIRTNNNCNYSFNTKDGREWNQTIVFAGIPDLNPKQTFNVTDGFKLSEFTPNRVIRDLVIRLVNEFNMIDIEIVFV